MPMTTMNIHGVKSLRFRVGYNRRAFSISAVRSETPSGWPADAVEFTLFCDTDEAADRIREMLRLHVVNDGEEDEDREPITAADLEDRRLGDARSLEGAGRGHLVSGGR